MYVIIVRKTNLYDSNSILYFIILSSFSLFLIQKGASPYTALNIILIMVQTWILLKKYDFYIPYERINIVASALKFYPNIIFAICSLASFSSVAPSCCSCFALVFFVAIRSMICFCNCIDGNGMTIFLNSSSVIAG